MKLTIDGKKVEAGKGATVLEAAAGAGIEIPAVCAHDALEPYGACRLCVVEVRQRGTSRWRTVASCLYPVRDGLEVRTKTVRVERHRRVLIELMLARCPGIPYVEELARTYGVERARFARGEDDCIMCGMCVRVCSEVVGASAIGFSSRGVDRRVSVPFGIDDSCCIACGACAYICPTGAIQMEYERMLELRRSEGEHRCRYALMGLVADAGCSFNYECAHCEVDQSMWERYGGHPLLAVRRRKCSSKGTGPKERPGRPTRRRTRGRSKGTAERRTRGGSKGTAERRTWGGSKGTARRTRTSTGSRKR
ncbi:MAG: (2Fe-2S)-binding protein [bacterium]|nr:MAG: (2Fe-2S)-binding protein [bacterium]